MRRPFGKSFLLPALLLSTLLFLVFTAHLEAGIIQGIPKLERNLLSREVMARSRGFVAAMSILDKRLDRFNQLLDLADRRDVRSALRGVAEAEKAHLDLQAAAADLDDYLKKNRNRLRDEGLEALLDLGELTGSGYRNLNQALSEYLAARKMLLSWVEDNFKALSAGDAETARRFKAIFNECEKKMEKEKELYYRQTELLHDFSRNHAELSEYLKSNMNGTDL